MVETPERNGEVLNWLLEGANDSAEGFRQGAALARNPSLQTLFTSRAEQREQLAVQIAAEVRSFSQTPSERGTVIGGAHRAFTYLRDAISHDSDKGLVDELLRRERAIAEKFQSAIDDPRLPSRARTVAADALDDFTKATDELASIEQQLPGAGAESAASSGRFQLNEDDHSFLQEPSGSTVLATGSSGTESRIERSQDTVVRLGIQSVAVATSQGGSLSVVLEAGGASSRGRDGPAPMERHLAVGQTVEVLVSAGAALPFKAYAVAEDAELLRTVVWSLDVVDSVASADESLPSQAEAAETTVAAEPGAATPF